MPDIERDTKQKGDRAAKDLEEEMEQILEPLGVAVEAAGDLLRRYAYGIPSSYLSKDVAEIVGCAVSESYEGAYRRLIEFVRRETLVEEAARSRPNGSSSPRAGDEGPRVEGPV